MNTLQTISKNELEPERGSRDWWICCHLNTFNQLRDFKLDRTEAKEWKDSLNRIYPAMPPERLAFVIDKLMTGELEYKPALGIQNLFKGLKQVEKIGDGYQIRHGEKISVNWNGE